jgi:hypothetical protein
MRLSSRLNESQPMRPELPTQTNASPHAAGDGAVVDAMRLERSGQSGRTNRATVAAGGGAAGKSRPQLKTMRKCVRI